MRGHGNVGAGGNGLTRNKEIRDSAVQAAEVAAAGVVQGEAWAGAFALMLVIRG